MCSRKPPAERQRMKDAEKAKKVDEEKRNEKDRDKQEHEKGNILVVKLVVILLYCKCNVFL
jgi:hypothetical protein